MLTWCPSGTRRCALQGLVVVHWWDEKKAGPPAYLQADSVAQADMEFGKLDFSGVTGTTLRLVSTSDVTVGPLDISAGTLGLATGTGLGVVASGTSAGLTVDGVDASGRSIGFYGEGPTPDLSVTNSTFENCTFWGMFLSGSNAALELQDVSVAGSLSGMRLSSM